MATSSNPFGWYEHLRTPRLDTLIEELDEATTQYLQDRPDAEALKDHLLRHLRPLVGAALEGQSIEDSLVLVGRVVTLLSERHPELLSEIPRGELLQALFDPRTTSEGQGPALAERALPRTGFTSSELFTGRERHLNLVEELRREIRTSESVDFVVSFLRFSGLRLLEADLRQARDRGVRVRVVTTVYLGATEVRAVQALDAWGAEVYLSYNRFQGRLHAKAWIFHRPRDLGTAYVGSSNLSKDALTDGLEWNVKATQRESPTLYRRTADSFEALVVDPEFERFSLADSSRLQEALNQSGSSAGTIRLRDLPGDLRRQIRDHLERTAPRSEDISLGPRIRAQGFQQEILDRLEGERTIHGRYRNLIVLPTGMGKTVVAALDYSRQIRQGDRPRLLFVAHREEILDQARRTFRTVLQDPEFGELWKGTLEPRDWNHVFGSIQTLNHRQDEFRSRWPDGDWFSYVIVDEAHHGTAASYRFLFSILHPRILLGLTATPERTDGSTIAQEFHGRFAAEVRLGEGIAREHLVPFHYFGIAEGVPDLSTVGWNGRYYQASELDARYAGEAFASVIASALHRIVGQPSLMRALAFCTGLRQAEFLSRWFEGRGYRSAWVSGNTPSEERRSLIGGLAEGDLNLLFTVDLFNEGVDIPPVDTVLFLRPTESLTVFLQQLGRGLRLSPGKTLLTVLDFVGRAHKDYDLSHKFRALLGVTRTDVQRQIKQGYPDLPPGCSIILERQAEVEILRHIAAQIPSSRQKLLSHVAEDRSLGFEQFLSRTGWEPEFVLDKGGLWYQMLDELDQSVPTHPRREETLKRWLLTSVLLCDSPDLLDLWLEALHSPTVDHPGADLMTQQWVKNANTEVWQNASEAWTWFHSDGRRIDEVGRWLRWHRDRIEARGLEVQDLPRLRQFCSYDFKTIAWGQNRATWGKTEVSQGGVLRISDLGGSTLCWNLIVTIRKSEADYSRETLYRDWALTQEEFHWESPNDWIAKERSGARFLSEIQTKVPVYLFVRELKKDRWGRTPPYLFLGPVTLIPGSVVGERPMAMKFRLAAPLPMVHFRVFCQEAVS